MSTLLKQAIAIAQRAVQLDHTRHHADALAHYEQCLDMLRRARAAEGEKSATVSLIDAKIDEYSKRARELHQLLSASTPAVPVSHPEIPDTVPDFDDDDDGDVDVKNNSNTKPAPAVVVSKPVTPSAKPTPPTVVVAKAPQPQQQQQPKIISETVEKDELVIKTSDDPNLLATLLAIGQRATEADRLAQFDRAFPLYRHLATSLVRLAKLENDVRARDTMLRFVKQYTDRAEQLRAKPESQKYRSLRVEKFVEERINAVPGGSVLAQVQQPAPAARPKSPVPPPTASVAARPKSPVPPAANIVPPTGAPPPSSAISSGHLAEIERVWSDILLVPFVADSMRAGATVSALQH
jgi:hypothetical protein